MNRHRPDISIPKRIKGSAILDSMIALTLLGALLTWLVIFNANNQRAKESKLLASQTETFAKVFAQYMDTNITTLLTQIGSGSSVTLNSQSIGSNYWPSDLAKTNMYGQTPCLTIIKNSNSGNLEALMYYVGGMIDITPRKSQLINDASVLLGNKGGVLSSNSVNGNSGWSISQGSQFLSNASQCGGALSSPSVAVNIDLLLNWNQNIQSNISITKSTDYGNTLNQKTLPGHMINTNTSKANINFASNSGIILDNSNAANPVMLQMGYGAGTNAATLSLTGTNVTTLEANTIQANQVGKVGDSCMIQEIGKTITDQGVSSSGAYQYLARNTLICTQNAMLCATNGNTCYLPSITNSIVFQNNNIGIQNSNGIFNCPSEVPFASSVITSSGGSSSSDPIQASLAGYNVTTGYSLTTTGAIIMQVTCSNMPLYQEN